MKQIRTLAAWRPDMTGYREMDTAYRIALKSLARHFLELHDEIADLDVMIKAIIDELAPELVARNSIGYYSAAQLLITVGANPERLKSEASFAALCGVSPVPASSGKTNRHRLNRGGDRAANSALHIIAICRLRCDERTQNMLRAAFLKACPNLKQYAASNVTSPARSSASSKIEIERSIRARSRLDKQKGVRGSQYLSIKYTERLAEEGIEPSVGSVGDSYDNALAESVIGLFKTEVINFLGPWTSELSLNLVFR